MYRKMSYTCTVICFDGVQRTFKNEGFFDSRETLQRMLTLWSGQPGPGGGTYEYFESPLQAFNNCLAPITKVPVFHGGFSRCGMFSYRHEFNHGPNPA